MFWFLPAQRTSYFSSALEWGMPMLPACACTIHLPRGQLHCLVILACMFCLIWSTVPLQAIHSSRRCTLQFAFCKKCCETCMVQTMQQINLLRECMNMMRGMYMGSYSGLSVPSSACIPIEYALQLYSGTCSKTMDPVAAVVCSRDT